jgi:hypothetical protein
MSSHSPATPTTHDDAQRIEFVLRPMDMTQILNASISLLLGSPILFLAAVVLANLPLLLWQAAALAAPDAWFVPQRYRSAQDLYGMLGTAARLVYSGRIDPPSLIALLVSLLSSLLQSAVLTSLIAARYRGRPLSLLDALANTQRALPRLLCAYAIPLIVMAAAAWLYANSNATAVLAVALLVAAFPTWLFLTQTTMLEGAGPLAAWKRSTTLFRRRAAILFGTWLTYELIFVVISAIPTFVVGMASALYPPGPRLNTLIVLAGNLAILLIEPLRESCATLLYFEQRRRTRDLDA